MSDIDFGLRIDDAEDEPPATLPRCPHCHSINTFDVEEDDLDVDEYGDGDTKWECGDCGYSWWEVQP